MSVISGFVHNSGLTASISEYGEIKVNSVVVKQTDCLDVPYHPQFARETLEKYLKVNKLI